MLQDKKWTYISIQTDPAALTEVQPETFLINLYFYICSILFPRGCQYHATSPMLYKGHTRSTNIKIQHKYMMKNVVK